MEPVCHFEQAQRVEKSSHLVCVFGQIGAKIPPRGFALVGMTAFSELADIVLRILPAARGCAVEKQLKIFINFKKMDCLPMWNVL